MPETKHAFKWTKSYDIDLESAEQYMLIKGVCFTEGEAKRGEIFEENNLRYATGAMAASALLGFATTNIDHWPEALPTAKELEDAGLSYNYNKYDIDKINEIYPPIVIIDAELSRNKVGPKQEEKWQTEYIAMCNNPKVYEMIKQNKFKGNSVEDFSREYSCDLCNAETGKCTCQVAGSKFITNTLVLEEVPNSNGTWVQAVNKNDIGTIVKPYGETKNTYTKKLDIILHRFKTNYQNHVSKDSGISKLKVKQHRIITNDLTEYQEAGKWKNGAESVIEFLVEDKQIDNETAESLGKFIYENPSLLNSNQLENLSADDLIEWYNHRNTIDRKKLHSFIHAISYKPKKIIKPHALLLTPEEANYRKAGSGEDEGGEDEGGGQEALPNNCAGCRWFSSQDAEPGDESTGTCQLVEGEITGGYVCDRWESLNPPEETEEEPAEEEPATDEPEENTVEETEIETTVETNTAEDTETVIDGTEAPTENIDEQQKELDLLKDKVKEIESEMEKQANTIPEKKPKVKATVSTTGTKIAQSQKLKTVESRINKLKTMQKNIGLICGTGMGMMQKQAEYSHIKKEIKHLEELKKKLSTQ